MIGKLFLAGASLLICLFAFTACGTEAPIVNIQNAMAEEEEICLALADTQNTENSERVRYISADSVVFSDLADFFSWTTHIVRAKVLDARGEPRTIRNVSEDRANFDLPEVYLVFTISTIEILEVFQGTHEKGDIREVSQMGGYMSGHTRDILINSTPLPIGEELILFLHDSRVDINSPLTLASYSQGAYRIAAPAMEAALSRTRRGQEFSITQAYELGILDAAERLQSVNPSNNLVVTLGDLMSLSESANENEDS